MAIKKKKIKKIKWQEIFLQEILEMLDAKILLIECQLDRYKRARKVLTYEDKKEEG